MPHFTGRPIAAIDRQEVQRRFARLHPSRNPPGTNRPMTEPIRPSRLRNPESNPTRAEQGQVASTHGGGSLPDPAPVQRAFRDDLRNATPVALREGPRYKSAPILYDGGSA